MGVKNRSGCCTLAVSWRMQDKHLDNTNFLKAHSRT